MLLMGKVVWPPFKPHLYGTRTQPEVNWVHHDNNGDLLQPPKDENLCDLSIDQFFLYYEQWMTSPAPLWHWGSPGSDPGEVQNSSPNGRIVVVNGSYAPLILFTVRGGQKSGTSTSDQWPKSLEVWKVVVIVEGYTPVCSLGIFVPCHSDVRRDVRNFHDPKRWRSFDLGLRFESICKSVSAKNVGEKLWLKLGYCVSCVGPKQRALNTERYPVTLGIWCLWCPLSIDT